MPIYKIDNQEAKQLGLKKDGFGDEFALRDFFADNLEEILGVRFLEKEYQITNGRIDTLGIDENNSPVIIEYKWKENEEIFSQGLHYLRWLRENKKHFNLLVQSKLGAEVEVSWERPRVILIAQGFSRYVKSAVQEHSNVELKAYTLYEGDVLHIENEYTPFPERRVKVLAVQVSDEGEEAEVANYDLDYHLGITSPEMKKAFEEIRQKILELPLVEEIADQKTGITYATTKSFVRFEFRPTWIQLLLRDHDYSEDISGAVEDITRYRYGYRGKVKFTPQDDINYIFSLVEASYNSTL